MLFFAFQIAKQEKNLVRFPVKDLQQVVKLKKSKCVCVCVCVCVVFIYCL